MRRFLGLLVAFCFLAGLTVLAEDQPQAQVDPSKCPMMGKMGGEKGMSGMMGEGKGKMGRGMMPQMMMKSMMERSMIATNDGGVVVMVGNALYKYDKNLKLLGEAQIKIDMEKMRGMKCQMDKNVPCKGAPVPEQSNQ